MTEPAAREPTARLGQDAIPLPEGVGLGAFIVSSVTGVVVLIDQASAVTGFLLLGLPFLLMCLFYGIAAFLLDRKRPVLAQIAVVGGLAAMGAAMFAVLEIFQVSRLLYLPDQLMIWAFAALVAAYLVPSQTSLVIAFFIGLAATYIEVVGRERPYYWMFLPFLVACFITSARMRSRPGLYASVAATIAWLVLTGTGISALIGWGLMLIASFAMVTGLTLWSLMQLDSLKSFELAKPLAQISMVAALLAALAMTTLFKVEYASGWTPGWLVTSLIVLTFLFLLVFTSTSRPQIHPVNAAILVVAGLGALAFPFVAEALVISGTDLVTRTLIGSGLYLGLAFWVIALGQRRRDSILMAAGATSILILIVIDFTGFTDGAYPDLEVLLPIVGAVFFGLVFGFQIMRKPEDGAVGGGPS